MIRIAVAVSHPVQYFSPLFQHLALVPEVTLKVFYSCSHGVSAYHDSHFDTMIAWDIPLLEGYDSEFLPLPHEQPERLSFLAVDNPAAPSIISAFAPDALILFGYAHRTNWRLARWAGRIRIPLLLISDSSTRFLRSVPRIIAKEAVVRTFYSYLDGAIYVSDRNYCYHRHFGIPHDRLFPGILPVDNRRFGLSEKEHRTSRREVRNRLGIPDRDFVVILPAKLVQGKRQVDLVKACSAVSTAGRRRVWALLVGDGRDRPLLETFAHEPGTPAVITGFVNQGAMPQYYAAADVVALCSEHESYGLALAEALALGLPVVASDRVGAVGSVGPAQPGRNAMVYRCGDVAGLADSIDRLANSDALYLELSRQSTALAEELDIGRAAAYLHGAIVKLLAKQSPSPIYTS